jgi:hypothetical protein
MTEARDSRSAFDPYRYTTIVGGSAVIGGLAAWAAAALPAWELIAILGVIVVLLSGAGVIAIHRH